MVIKIAFEDVEIQYNIKDFSQRIYITYNTTSPNFPHINCPNYLVNKGKGRGKKNHHKPFLQRH